ncbi:MAG TPA: GAF domain-containing protein, partial [Kofleriaceae bacterium]|nr:GAF domain-containing protein [Kofleriaceae bacterium]
MTTSAVVRTTTRRPANNSLAVLVELAADLTAHLATADRSQRLVDIVQRALRCDSAALLRLDGDALVPVAAYGLVPELMSQRFVIADHPRFAQILRRREVIRFHDASLPDPFDGLLASGLPLSRVHACIGAPLVVEGEIEGVLAIDALDPGALDDVDTLMVAGLATIAAAGLRTTRLIDALEKQANDSEQLVRQLARDGE